MEGTDGLYPPMYEHLVEYSSLGASHLTLSHRGMKANMKSSITGKVWTDAGERGLKHVLAIGHRYYVVKGEIPDADAKELSESQNADQNQNAFNGDAQNMRKVLTICNELQTELGPHVPIGTIILRKAQFRHINLTLKTQTNS